MTSISLKENKIKKNCLIILKDINSFLEGHTALNNLHKDTQLLSGELVFDTDLSSTRSGFDHYAVVKAIKARKGDHLPHLPFFI